MSIKRREIDNVIAVFGSQTALAKALGLSNNAVCKWVKRGFIPARRISQVNGLVNESESPLKGHVTLDGLLNDAERGYEKMLKDRKLKDQGS